MVQFCMKDKKCSLCGSFIEERRQTLDYAKRLKEDKSSDFSIRQLNKRIAKLIIVCELDALAGLIYGSNNTKKAFIDMLCNWTEDDIFSAISPEKLQGFFEDNTGFSEEEVFNKMATVVENLKKKNFSSRDKYNQEKHRIVEELELNEEQSKICKQILWRISDEDRINGEYLENYKSELKCKKDRHKNYSEKYQKIKPFLDEIKDRNYFVRREDFIKEIDSFLKEKKFDKSIENLLKDNLHHASYASYVYEFRCECVHNFGGSDKECSISTFEGKLVGSINIDLLLSSSEKILNKLQQKSDDELEKMFERRNRRWG